MPAVALVLENIGSLITYKNEEGQEQSLGHLLVHEGRAFDPSFGCVDVSPADAKTHNQLLDEALLSGLDNCRIGQGGHFYWVRKPNLRVHTWTGLLVSDNVSVQGRNITFRRNGMVFSGKITKGVESFNFVRTE